MRRRRDVLPQLLLFCLVGVIVITLYDVLVLQTTGENDNEYGITTYKPSVSTPTIIPVRKTPTIIPPRKKVPVNCQKIIEDDKDEIDKANKYMNIHPPVLITDHEFIKKTKDCVRFRQTYDVYPVTKEERDFPIAFSIVTYKDVDQTERLLRTIYRTQNVYCIHVDLSAPDVIHKAMAAIADCFGNVFIVSKTEDVIYNHMTRLKADLNCMSDLLSLPQKWKYFINLPHQQFPLKTNLEMVKILKIYNGANDIEGIITPGRMMDIRFKYSYKYINFNDTWERLSERTNKAPYNATIVKGSAYGIFSRAFVHYIINSEEAKNILKFMEDVKSPDEYYWATLHHNKVLNAPGRYTDHPERKPWLAVYAAWGGRDSCHGKYVRGVCVFGIGDLNELVSKKELFANKFYADYQYLTLDCLEEYLYNRTISQLPFETFYYKQLPFILKQ